jgi:hypothetical protein
MIYIHLYFNELEVERFKAGGKEVLFGFIKEVRTQNQKVHLSIPLGKVRQSTEIDGAYILDRDDFEEEFKNVQ